LGLSTPPHFPSQYVSSSRIGYGLPSPEWLSPPPPLFSRHWHCWPRKASLAGHRTDTRVIRFSPNLLPHYPSTPPPPPPVTNQLTQKFTKTPPADNNSSLSAVSLSKLPPPCFQTFFPPQGFEVNGRFFQTLDPANFSLPGSQCETFWCSYPASPLLWTPDFRLPLHMQPLRPDPSVAEVWSPALLPSSPPRDL